MVSASVVAIPTGPTKMPLPLLPSGVDDASMLKDDGVCERQPDELLFLSGVAKGEGVAGKFKFLDALEKAELRPERAAGGDPLLPPCADDLVGVVVELWRR